MKRSSRRASLSQSSDSAKRSVDYKAKYEKLLTETLMDYESTVRTAQQRAEKFTKVKKKCVDQLAAKLQLKEELIEELKAKATQNEEACSIESAKVHDLKKELKKMEVALAEERQSRTSVQEELEEYKRKQSEWVEMTKHRVDFLECLSCVRVQPRKINDEIEYYCAIDDGWLNGHCFSVKLDTAKWEYKYTPHECSNKLPPDSELRKTMYFPDSMIPRFHMKLLAATYKNFDKDTI